MRRKPLAPATNTMPLSALLKGHELPCPLRTPLAELRDEHHKLIGNPTLKPEVESALADLHLFSNT